MVDESGLPLTEVANCSLGRMLPAAGGKRIFHVDHTERLLSGTANFSHVGVGTQIAEGKPVHTVNGQDYIVETALPGDVALIKAHKVDPRGNLIYRLASQNMNPVMAMAAKHTIAEVDDEVALGDLDPAHIITPGVFVDRYVVTGRYKPEAWDGAWHE